MPNYRQLNNKTKKLTNQGKAKGTNEYKTSNNSSLSTVSNTFAYMKTNTRKRMFLLTITYIRSFSPSEET